MSTIADKQFAENTHAGVRAFRVLHAAEQPVDSRQGVVVFGYGHADGGRSELPNATHRHGCGSRSCEAFEDVRNGFDVSDREVAWRKPTSSLRSQEHPESARRRSPSNRASSS